MGPFEVHLPLLVLVEFEQFFSKLIHPGKLRSVGLSLSVQIFLDVSVQVDNKMAQYLEHIKGQFEDRGGLNLCYKQGDHLACFKDLLLEEFLVGKEEGVYNAVFFELLLEVLEGVGQEEAEPVLGVVDTLFEEHPALVAGILLEIVAVEHEMGDVMSLAGGFADQDLFIFYFLLEVQVGQGRFLQVIVSQHQHHFEVEFEEGGGYIF